MNKPTLQSLQRDLLSQASAIVTLQRDTATALATQHGHLAAIASAMVPYGDALDDIRQHVINMMQTIAAQSEEIALLREALGRDH